jgi:hypothetical protein
MVFTTTTTTTITNARRESTPRSTLLGDSRLCSLHWMQQQQHKMQEEKKQYKIHTLHACTRFHSPNKLPQQYSSCCKTKCQLPRPSPPPMQQRCIVQNSSPRARAVEDSTAVDERG